MLRNVSGYLPLPDCLTIKKSRIHGLGLFATEQIPKGHYLGITHVSNSDFPNGYVRTPLGGFINHSFNPNCDMPEDGKYYKLVTLREIRKGEELTVDYKHWYDKELLATFR
jgi:SET domain-containing protein